MSTGNYNNNQYPTYLGDPLSGSIPQEQLINDEIPMPSESIEPINEVDLIENRFDNSYPVKQPTIKEEDTEEYKRKQELEKKVKEFELEKKKDRKDKKREGR